MWFGGKPQGQSHSPAHKPQEIEPDFNAAGGQVTGESASMSTTRTEAGCCGFYRIVLKYVGLTLGLASSDR